MGWFRRSGGHECEELELLRTAVRLLGEIRYGVCHGKIQSVGLRVMPKTIEVGGTAQAVISGFDQFGKPFPITSSDTVTLNASVPEDVTFGAAVFNADGTVNVPVTGVVATVDDSLTATVGAVVSSADTLTITAPVVPTLTTATLALQ